MIRLDDWFFFYPSVDWKSNTQVETEQVIFSSDVIVLRLEDILKTNIMTLKPHKSKTKTNFDTIHVHLVIKEWEISEVKDPQHTGEAGNEKNLQTYRVFKQLIFLT